ncbi:hypothetical protein ACS0TY_031316 [Phlomoides rotata]
MALQQYLVQQEWETLPKESEKTSACFDCSICLDFASDPVVTLCGHLYCWPCIYKWFDSQTASLPSNERPQCPVCKAEISEKTMVPLYGRGQSIPESGAQGKVIPPRPAACGVKGLTEMFSPEQQLASSGNHFQNRYYGQDSSPQLFNVAGNADVSTVGMFGEMVYARVFGNSESLYAVPNSYQTAVSRTPRLRRQELQADKSLHRITVFLFCFFLLCLLVF